MTDDSKATDDSPSVRQLLHWATGDRHAEAEALKDRAGDVDGEAAEVAVRRAHGDIQPEVDEPPIERAAESDVARPADAEAVQDEEG